MLICETRSILTAQWFKLTMKNIIYRQQTEMEYKINFGYRIIHPFKSNTSINNKKKFLI
jgi:hypothetical protein